MKLDAFLDHARTHAAPRARKDPVEITQLGHSRTDEYAWLRDADWRAVMKDPSRLDPGIREHLEAENAYAEAVLQPLSELRETVFQEMRGRIKEDDSTPPSPNGGFAYYTRYREGGQYPIFARKPVGDPNALETVLLDGDAEGEGLDYFDLAAVEHSPDHQRLAWCADTTGSEYYTLLVRDLSTGETIVTITGEASGDAVWGVDSKTLYWVWRDDNGRPKRLYRYRLDTNENELLYEEADDGFFMTVSLSETRDHVVLLISDHTSTEIHLIDAHDPSAKPVRVEPQRTDVEYYLSEGADAFYVLTNAGGAVDFQIMRAPKDAPEATNWEPLIPHRPGVLVLAVLSFKTWLVRLERENALPRIVVRNQETGEETPLSFDEAAYALGLEPGYEFETDRLRFSYSSPTRPQETYDVDMRSGDRTLIKRQAVPSGHDPANYVVRRIEAISHDGERVPVTILRHRDTPEDASAPGLLYGYGSYGITIPAAFRIKPLSLVDRGVVFAIAHIRGGKAKGFQWYQNGRREKKPNTFHDFVAAADALTEQGFVQRGRLVAHGGSAGGLLVGAAINMAPDRFAGAIAAVPFVDVLNTMSDAELPLTPPEWPEWGDPLTDVKAYETILSYSPYDQVSDQAYPHILITAGLTDPRVTYWEPAKWAARLRDRRSDDGLTILKTEMGAGHGGKSGRFDALKDDALEYAFALTVLKAA